ncbi:hypothetical protein DFJ74DRAFT_272610 [Hyaloraphidium curvatum]|nr:hypothetical protein DFJ74DRAFT_272610 [Hyaloraphidium curvatum]
MKFFGALPELELLHFDCFDSFNAGERLLQHQPELKHLRLRAGNGAGIVGDLRAMSNLRTLRLDNSVVELCFDDLGSCSAALTELRLQRVNIKRRNPVRFPELTYLEIAQSYWWPLATRFALFRDLFAQRDPYMFPAVRSLRVSIDGTWPIGEVESLLQAAERALPSLKTVLLNHGYVVAFLKPRFPTLVLRFEDDSADS